MASLPSGPPASSGVSQTFGERNFMLLLASSALWYMARWIETVALGWLVLEMTNSPWQVALVGFYRMAMLPVAGCMSGVIADRLDRRNLLVYVQVANLGITLLILGLIASGSLTTGHIALASLGMGIGWALDFPSRRALLADVVSRSQLRPAVVLDSISMNLMKIAGPVAGGVLLAFTGAGGCYALLGVAYVVSILLLARMTRTVPRKASSSGSALQNLAEGLRYAWTNRTVFGVMVTTVGMNLLFWPFPQLMPVFARDVLGVGAVGLGVLAAADGVGALIAGLVLSAAGRLRREGVLFLVGSIFASLALVGFAFSNVFGLSVGMLFLAGVGHLAFATFQTTILLDASDESFHGRMMGVLMASIGSQPIGILLLGAVAEGLGAPMALGAYAIASAAWLVATWLMYPSLARHMSGSGGERVGAASRA